MTGSEEPQRRHSSGLGDVSQWPGVSAQNLARWAEHPARAMERRWARWDDVWAVDAGSPSAFLNGATLQQPLRSELAAELVERLAAFYAAGASDSWLLWSPWPTPDLQAYGLRLLGHPPLMVRPVGENVPPVPADLRIIEVHDDEQLRAFEQVLVEGYPMPELQPFEPGRVFDARALSGPWRAWLGYAGERPVTIASAYVGERAVGIYTVATLPEFRGRGYGAALTVQAAQAEPALPAELQASDDGRPVYLRLGFHAVTSYTLWMAPRTTVQGDKRRE